MKELQMLGLGSRLIMHTQVAFRGPDKELLCIEISEHEACASIRLTSHMARKVLAMVEDYVEHNPARTRGGDGNGC